MFVAVRRFLRRHRLTQTVSRTFLAVVVGAAVIVFGSKFWIEYRVNGMLEEAAANMRGVGSLSFSGVSANFDGELRVRDLAFRPSEILGAAAIPLIMREAVLDFGSYLALLQADRRDPPDRLELQLNGLRLDLGVSGTVITGNPAEALACGDVLSFEPVDLERMGFQDPQANLRLGYRLNRISDSVVFHTELETGDAASSRAELVLQVPELGRALRSRNPLIGSDVRLQRASFVSDASRFNKRRNALCAEELDVTPEQALEANVEAFVALLGEAGLAADEVFIDHYRGFMEGLGPWTLAAEPDAPLSLMSLGDIDTLPELLRRLDARSSIGNRGPSRFELEEVQRVAVGRSDDDRAASRGFATVGRWAQKPLDALPRYEGRNVSISTITGKRYLGELLDVDDDEITLRARLPGGQAVVPIPIAQLRNFRVYEIYRPEDPNPSEAG